MSEIVFICETSFLLLREMERNIEREMKPYCNTYYVQCNKIFLEEHMVMMFNHFNAALLIIKLHRKDYTFVCIYKIHKYLLLDFL